MAEDLDQGVLDGFLAPFGQQLVDPGGAVTDMMGYTQAPVAVEAPVAVQEPVAQPQSQGGLYQALFGDVTDPQKNGLLGGMFGGAQPQPNPTNFGQFTQAAQYDYPAPAAAMGAGGKTGVAPVQTQPMNRGQAMAPGVRPSYAIQAPGPGYSMFGNPTASGGPLPGSRFYQGEPKVAPNTMSNAARQLVGQGWKFPMYPPQPKR